MSKIGRHDPVQNPANIGLFEERNMKPLGILKEFTPILRETIPYLREDGFKGSTPTLWLFRKVRDGKMIF
jgi:hypothetical protein